MDGLGNCVILQVEDVAGSGKSLSSSAASGYAAEAAAVTGQGPPLLDSGFSMVPALARAAFDRDTRNALEAMLVAEPLEDPFGRVPLFARRRTVDPPCGSTLKNAIDDAGEGIQLGAADRLAAPIARRHRKPQHLGDRLAVKPKYPQIVHG